MIITFVKKVISHIRILTMQKDRHIFEFTANSLLKVLSRSFAVSLIRSGHGRLNNKQNSVHLLLPPIFLILLFLIKIGN
jgi:hypothetical protein